MNTKHIIKTITFEVDKPILINYYLALTFNVHLYVCFKDINYVKEICHSN